MSICSFEKGFSTEFNMPMVIVLAMGQSGDFEDAAGDLVSFAAIHEAISHNGLICAYIPAKGYGEGLYQEDGIEAALEKMVIGKSNQPSPPKKLNWCDYEVSQSHQPTGGPYFIQENGTWQGRGSASIYARDGIKFFHEGKDANLWLVRDGKATRLASRMSGRVGLIDSMVKIDPKFNAAEGVHIRDETPWIMLSDGFVITTNPNLICQAGEPDTEEENPRPTMWVPS